MLPAEYSWLPGYVADGHPQMVVEALKLYGVHEGLGDKDNPTILSWARELGLTNYVHDSIAWCGLFMALVAHRSGKPVPHDPLWAANWLDVGETVVFPLFGDILVFHRPGGHHVGLNVGEDEVAYHVLGGNESDQVKIIREPKIKIAGARRPPYIDVPSQVQLKRLSILGSMSLDESTR